MAPMTGVVVTEWTPDLESSPKDLTGKTLLVVGGTSGLGRAIAQHAVKQGASVTVVGRSFKDDPAKVKFIQSDLSLMKEAKKIGETVDPADVVVFTQGIVPKTERETSGEGIEMDLAVSYLSRLVILKYLVPRLKTKARVFIMGFPGSSGGMKMNVEDLNSEKSYKGGFDWVHINTVVGNEALVHDYAKKYKAKNDGVLFFGLNPGLIKTDIRGNMYTSGVMKYVGPVLESAIGMFGTTPEAYASKMVPLLFSPSLDGKNGSLFNPNAQPVMNAEHFTKDPELVSKFVQAGEKTVQEKAGIIFR